ncbi:aspartate aminotransferase family protein [Flavisphingomonas formosensis]|uniref:aspartate aminotransferase family protein n=1 Tax=Flavisphingomonas formosensis TaxID=861534 RepID=UPI0012FBF614|nr:aminotransferase class III-fold pyridoxal phosphate-dependent enzyme [Sphingomonas formosensis]
MNDTELLERRISVLGRNAPLFYDRPLHIVRGEGVWLEDADGRRYLDVYNNVPNVGHCRREVVEAIAAQAATLNIHTRYLHENVVRYAERLTAQFEPQLSAAMFTCTGTESNELALRLARYRTGGTGIIVSDFNYHGNSMVLAELTTAFSVPERFGRHARAVSIPDPYRAAPGQSLEQLAEQFADKVSDAIQSLEADGIKLAALLFDSVFSSEGLPALVPGYLAKAVERVRAAGGLFIADEVQGGFGRTGTSMWSYQDHGVVPDLVTLGKPMANGHPVGGVIADRDLVDAFGKAATYFNTFGGNPVSAAAGLATLDIVERDNLRRNAREVGGYIRAGLERLAARHEIIGDVRGRGLFFGLELVEDRASKTPATAQTKLLINRMRERGVLMSRIGKSDNILKMRPPLIFTVEHADLLLATLDDALGTL